MAKATLFLCVIARRGASQIAGDLLNKFTKIEVSRLIEEAAALTGYSVYEYHIQMRKGSSVVSVMIDNGGKVSHGDCAKYSTQLDRLIEASGIEDNYTLEIASPGLKRELRNIDELRRFIGAPVKIIYDLNNGFVAKGILKSVEAEELVVKEEKKLTTIQLKDIKRSNLDY